jgi:hypothetical protein
MLIVAQTKDIIVKIMKMLSESMTIQTIQQTMQLNVLMLVMKGSV